MPSKQRELPTSPTQKPADTKLGDKLAHEATEAPQVHDVLAKAAAALERAQKQKKLQTWKCTECGGGGIQLYMCGDHSCQDRSHPQDGGSGHFKVALDAADGTFVTPKGEPITHKCQRKTLTLVLAGNCSTIYVKGAKRV